MIKRHHRVSSSQANVRRGRVFQGRAVCRDRSLGGLISLGLMRSQTLEVHTQANISQWAASGELGQGSKWSDSHCGKVILAEAEYIWRRQVWEQEGQ